LAQSKNEEGILGFEVVFEYHERKVDGSYDTQNRLELKKKVGNGCDDTPLEKLAASVLSQLARRDIWVVDVKVVEFVRKEVNFKESKDGRGIVLKNKKFSFDGSVGLVVDEVQDAEPELAAAMNSVAVVPAVKAKVTGGNLAPIVVNQSRVLFKVTYDPEGRNRIEADSQGFKLTFGKKYSVHRQHENPLGGHFGNILTISDDANKPIEVDEKYFTVVGAGLMGGEEFNRDFQRDKEPRLSYDNGRGQAQSGSRRLSRENIPEQFRHIPIEGEEMADDSFMEMPELRPNYKP